tara:strand:- start:9770 stop:11026 length:1257 start_codon:yes stop_codon:yes gene_type:complete
MNCLDLFSGIGGFSLGMKQAGINIDHHFNSDIDTYANAVYKYNFKNSKNVGSVTDVSGKQLPKIDIITFGSPCQDFSLAGKRSGMGGERSSLITEAIRLIWECRPSVFVWENVKGTFSSNNGEDFWAIIKEFTNIGGYRLEWQLLNTKWFLPQNRERIYLVGHLAEGNTKEVFPIGEDDRKITKLREVHRVTNFSEREFGWKDYSPCLAARDYKDPKLVKVADYRNDEGMRYRKDGDSPCLSARRHSEKDPSTMPPIVVGDYRYDEGFRERKDGNAPSQLSQFGALSGKTLIKSKHKTVSDDTHIKVNDKVINPLKGTTNYGWHLEQNIYDKKSMTRSLKSTEGSGNKPKVIIKDLIRRLTPIECERLQGFPDNWTRYGDFDGEIKEISDTQRYKQCGNAVTVDVVREVFSKLYPQTK